MTTKQKLPKHLQRKQLEQSGDGLTITDGEQQQLDSAGNLVPVHLRRLNSSSSLEEFKPNNSPKSSSATPANKSSTRSTSSWWSVDDLSYPGIPFQVARYLCETSPDLINSMAATLQDTGVMKPTQRPHSKMSSPLLHLNLQETVIDGKTLPEKVVIPTSTPGETSPSLAHSDSGFNSNDVSYVEFRKPTSEMVSIKSPKDEEAPAVANDEVALRESSRNSHFEIKSVASDLCSNYELDSNYELQSNISDTSGFEEEMFRIKKLLLESPRSINGDDSAHFHLDLLREKAALEGRVEALALELNHVMTERAELLGELSSAKTQLQSQVNVANRTYHTEIINDLTGKLEESEYKIRQLEEIVLKLETQLESTSEEAIQARSELKETEEESNELKIAVRELKVEAEMKEGAVRGLKSKVTELHVKLESAIQSKSIVEGDLHASKAQIVTEQEMKDWYRNQLQQTQSAKSKMQQELIALQAALAEAEAATEKMRFERDQCKRNLAETQRKAVDEKESLLRHLQNIEADVIERENTFKELQRDATSVDEAILNGVKKLDEERVLLTEEKFATSDLRRQLEVAQLDSEMRLTAVRKMETETAQLMKQLTVLQKTVSEKELEVHQVQERCSELETTQREQQATLIEKSEVISKLKQEKVALEVQLSGAREEKREMDSVINDVRENVMKIDARTKHMKEELNSKNETLNRLEKENGELKDELKKLRETEEKFQSRLQYAESELLKAQEELTIRRIKEPRLQEAINNLSDQLTQLQGENALLKDKISILEKYNINNVNSNSVQEYASGEDDGRWKEKLRVKEDELAKLADSQAETAKKSQRFESNVKVLTRKLRETLKTKNSLEEELKQLKSATPNDEILTSVSKTKDAKISYYRKKLLTMETKLNETIQAYEEEKRRADKNQESLLELERQKGKLHALADSSSALKQQTNHLEATLSVTEEAVSQLHQINNEIVVKKQQEEALLKAALKDVENKLKSEQDTLKETRKQMYKEKCESSSLRKHLTSTRTALDEANRMLEAKGIQLTESQAEIDRQRITVSQGVSEAAELRSRLNRSQETMEKLQQEVEEGRAKDSLLADQIKTLGWHLQQKKQELARLQQQINVSGERHTEELRRVNETLNRAHKELESVKEELQVAVKEKLSFQSKVTELRAAIKSTLEKSRAQQQMSSTRLPISPPPFDETLITNLLQQSLTLPECRPLSNLQVCVNTLKQEMAILQQQLLEQTNGAV
ncbi:Golgin A3 [Chamberlinius hualienensis]